MDQNGWTVEKIRRKRTSTNQLVGLISQPFSVLIFVVCYFWISCLGVGEGVGCTGEIKIQISSVKVNDEGLTLEGSAFQIFQGGNSTFSNSFDKTKFSWDHDQNGLIAAAKDAFTYWCPISTHRRIANRHEIVHDMCDLLINTDITFHYITTASSVILAVIR